MNKETRIWITGVIAILFGYYFSNEVLKLQNPEKLLLLDVIRTIMYLFFVFIMSWGIGKVLKSIK